MKPAPGLQTGTSAAIDDYLRCVETHLDSTRLDADSKRDILAELRTHLVERVSDFEAEGSSDATGQALSTLGDPVEIATEFAAAVEVRAASRSYSPASLASAAYTASRTLGQGLRLFVVAIAGYSLAVGALCAAAMKLVRPERVGFWIGDHGILWGTPPRGALAREFAGDWFIPISVWLAVVAAVGTTLLLRRYLAFAVATRHAR